MARCEQGYLCDVCGAEVEDIADSDLYLRYVLGEVDPETLHRSPERHLACNPTLAQFIEVDGFPAPVVEGYFDRRALDPAFDAAESARVTAGYLRLRAILAGVEADITAYPLPGVAGRWSAPHAAHP